MPYGYPGISTAVPLFCCVIEAEVYPFTFCSHSEMLCFLTLQSSASLLMFDIETKARVYVALCVEKAACLTLYLYLC